MPASEVALRDCRLFFPSKDEYLIGSNLFNMIWRPMIFGNEPAETPQASELWATNGMD